MKIADRRRVPEASTKPDRLAFKTAESESGQLLALDEAEGIVTAIVSVTGTEDEVADIIVPGAYRETLAKRRPKVCWAHSWEHPIGRVLHIEELMPGDDRLPKSTKDGSPWPREAGALVATMQFNLRSDEGKNAFAAVVFYSETGECEYSIGYQVPAGRSSRDGKGVRHIKMLELYELSVVLFGAHTMTGTISIKAAMAEIIERKAHRGQTGTVSGAQRRGMTAKDVLASLRAQRKAAPPFQKADESGEGGDGEKTPVKPVVTEKDDLPQHDADTNLTTESCPCGDLLVFDTGNGWQRLDGSYSHDDGTTHSDWILPPDDDADDDDAEAPEGEPVDAPGTPAADAAAAEKIEGSGDQTVPDHTDGVMIALYPDAAAADQIAQAIAGTDQTLPRNELHVTLAYLGTVTEVGMSSDEIIAKLTPVLEGVTNLTGTLGGIGQFPLDPEAAKDGVGAPTWIPVDVEGIGMLRETIAQTLADEMRGEHGFTPHMTIGYGIGVIDPLPSIPVTFDAVHIVYGTQDRTITLGSNPFIEGGDDETKDANMRYLHLTTDEVAALTALSEVKAGGADRNRGGAEDLRAYWTTGPGGAKIKWGTPGDFTRCVRLLEEHMPGRAEGYCANRHKEMTGMWPGDKGNKSADAYDPSLEGDQPEAKNVDPGLAKGFPRLAGSYEERNDALMAAVTEALRGDEYDEGRWEWPGICVDATYDEHVVVTRHKYDGTDERQTFQMPYTMNADGSVDLGPMDQVELEVVAIAVGSDDGPALGDDMPFAEGLHQIAHHFKVAHEGAMEAKAGRVLSGQNERRLRQAVENLVNVLSNAGMNIRLAEGDDDAPGDLPGKPGQSSDVRKPPPPEADLSTTSPSGAMKAFGNEGVIETKGDVVVLDASSVEDVLRGLKIED